MPQNIQTPLDYFGALIDPRQEGEELYAYKKRLAQVAEAMLERDLTPNENKPSWLQAREDELEGRVGERVELEAGGDDPELIEKGESQNLSYENLEDREGPFRWPQQTLRGERPYYGWGKSKKGGVSTPGSLLLHQRTGGVYMQPGYIDSEEGFYYVGAQLKSTVLHLPPGTEKTVLVPWDIESDHPHKITVVDENTVALEGSDHTHHVNYLGEQLGFMGSGTHTHDITRHDYSGAMFPVTTSSNANTALGTSTGTQTASGGFAGNRFAIPTVSLRPVTVEIDEHKTVVSPHDFWRGTFSLVAEDHSHQVTDWEVEEVFGHTHAISRPIPPATRPLVPRLSNYEGQQLLSSIQSPYVLDLQIENGWVVGRVDGGFSEELRLFYETGELREVPYEQFLRQHTEDTALQIGITPALEPAHIHTEVVKAAPQREVVLRVRVEDKHTGGIAGEEVTATWDNNSGQAVQMTHRVDCCGAAVFRIPVDSQASILISLSSGEVNTAVDVPLQDSQDITGSYGFNYGMSYGM